MKLFVATRNLARSLDYYSHFNPSPLSIKQFIDFGKFLAFIYPFIVLVRRAACTKTTSRSATARRLARSSTSWTAVHFHICHIGF